MVLAQIGADANGNERHRKEIMEGILKEAVRFNGLTLEPGTKVYFEENQDQRMDDLHPTDSIIATVILGYYMVKVIVRKSQIFLNCSNN